MQLIRHLKFRSRDAQPKDKQDQKLFSARKQSIESLRKIRYLISQSLRMKKNKQVPKPLERLQESLIENDATVNEQEKKAEKLIAKSNVNQIDHSLALDCTQSDPALSELVTAEQPIHPKLALPKSSGIIVEDYTQNTNLPNLTKYDPEILKLKMKRRIRLYAKISFCLIFAVFSMTFIIFIIAMLGWLVLLIAYDLIGFERRIRHLKNERNDLLEMSRYSSRYGVMKISSLSWNAWTNCFQNFNQSVRWRSRSVSPGLYFVDQQVFMSQRCETNLV
ncbi:unnamed protein product [Thelazia callipaeda]|uniref:Uncharacterized protein n=1 Tax=Thelazia callipaeda TaxID=103827 RepID=A0A0N5D1Q7_THECL|nr:unnamed protein product [Thelazia callipaeda]